MSTLTVRLEYVHPWPNAAGLFVARNENLLLNKGFDFEITFGGYDRGDPVTLLDRGEADVAVVPPNRLINARSNGAKVVGIAAINQRPLEALITTSKTGITRPKDLSGRSVGMMPSARLETFVRQAVAIDGGDPDSVNIAYTGGYEPDITDVLAGRFDAVLNIKAWEPLLADLPAEERVVLPFDEWGGPQYPSYLWAVRETLVERNPELVSAFVEAIAKGYQIAINEPKRAVDALQPALLNRRPWLIAESLALVAPTWTKNGQWGIINENDVSTYAEWLVEHKLLKSSDYVKGAVNNTFVESALKKVD